MVGGIFMEMPGTAGPLKAASTFLGGHALDRAVANALRHHARAHALVPWRKGAGNDETVWEAPGYEVPFVELTRCEDQFAPYREYHSSLDTPELMDPAQLEETLLVLQKAVEALRGRRGDPSPLRRAHLPVEPEYDLYLERPDPAVIKNLAGGLREMGPSSRLPVSLFRRPHHDPRDRRAPRPALRPRCADTSTASRPRGWSTSSGPRSTANRRPAPAMLKPTGPLFGNQPAKPVERDARENRHRAVGAHIVDRRLRQVEQQGGVAQHTRRQFVEQG